MLESNYVELDLELIHMTADAIYVSDGTTQDWIPRSQVKDGNWLLGFDDVGKTLSLEVTEWAAKQARLI